jgi:hypothetical protein
MLISKPKRIIFAVGIKHVANIVCHRMRGAGRNRPAVDWQKSRRVVERQYARNASRVIGVVGLGAFVTAQV